ncbi:MAG: hypothetical protein HYX54_08370 [Chloroflexi bacterium]|nr:hypothetical protein [Chloroflexota bacterium]
MDDAFERVLRLVSEGRLTVDEAGPILDALAPARRGRSTGAAETASASEFGDGIAAGFTADAATRTGPGAPRFARIEVRDGGKRVVDLRIPISLGRIALGRVPGLSAAHIADVEEAVASGNRGPILDVEDAHGDGVRIVLE